MQRFIALTLRRSNFCPLSSDSITDYEHEHEHEHEREFVIRASDLRPLTSALWPRQALPRSLAQRAEPIELSDLDRIRSV